MVAGAGVRRRSRQPVSRPKTGQFSLTLDEFNAVSRAAAQAGWHVGVCRGSDVSRGLRYSVPGGFALREALADLMSAAGLVRRVGTNLNQAVARLNATGQRGEDLLPAAAFCAQVVRRLDEAAEYVRRSIP